MSRLVLPTCRRLGPLLAASLALSSCYQAEGPADATAGVERIVLVTLDTLRADHLGCYGYPRATSPFLDRLAGEGILFERAFAPMATTMPSHTAMFTSLYPLQTGVLKNGDRLDAEFVTMAEQLQDLGFQTAAFVSTDSHFGVGGLDQGFAHFDEPVDAVFYRDAHETVGAALRWIADQEPSTRFFIWIHLFDAHVPLSPPASALEPFRSQTIEQRQALIEFLERRHHVDAAYIETLLADPAWRQENMPPSTAPPGPVAVDSPLLELMDNYDASILFADKELERLHRGFEESGLNRAALWIVTGDHGEGLGTHSWMGHSKHIYNEQLQVPLIWWRPQGRLEPRVVDGVVETLDILPTVMKLLDSDLPEMGKTVQGISLQPFLAGDPGAGADRYAFAQRRQFGAASIHKPNFEAGTRFAIQDRDFKYIFWTAGSEQFYDLRADPYETDNLAGNRSAALSRLRGALQKTIAELNEQTSPQITTTDAETLEKLRALGYVQ